MIGSLLGGVFMGWSLGANDSANVFGTAVASKIISFRGAALLCSVMVILGAYLQGAAGMHTYRELAHQEANTLLITSVAAALSVTFMTLRGIPISASHAMVGAITGIGLATDSVNWTALTKVFICWLATPIGAMLIAMAVHFLLQLFIRKVPMSILTRDQIIWSGLIVVGCYGAYALGANNVANVTGIYSGQLTQLGLNDSHLALIGGCSIAFGTITFSKRVMRTVGRSIMKLDGFASFVAVLSMALTVHIFAMIGVPVSTSHAVVGAILGSALLRFNTDLNYKALCTIVVAWLTTPFFSLILASAGYAIFL